MDPMKILEISLCVCMCVKDSYVTNTNINWINIIF